MVNKFPCNQASQDWTAPQQNPETLGTSALREVEFPKFYFPHDSGLHQYQFKYACLCAEEGIEPELALSHLTACVAKLNYKRVVPPRELSDAVNNAYRMVGDGSIDSIQSFPKYDAAAAARIAKEFGTTREDLVAASPQTPPVDPTVAIVSLFGGDEFVCLAPFNKRFFTYPLDYWLLNCTEEILKFQFIVPHPMSAKFGLTKGNGHKSQRTHSNTGVRRRVVCDFDEPGPLLQPSLIAYLADFCQQDPELVLTSGGKSLHAWWRIDGWSDDDILTFEEEAARVGADPALLGDSQKCQLVRLPAGTRKNADGTKPQTILFWNPKSLS